MRYNNKSLADAFARGVTDGKANNLFIKRGEFVRRLNADGTAQSKVYARSYYDAESQRYALDDVEDTSRQVFVKKGTKLQVGFTY